MRKQRNMYRPSILSCVLHHPWVFIKTYIKSFFVTGLLLCLIGRSAMTYGEFKLFLLVNGLIALCMIRGAVEKMEEKRNAPQTKSMLGTAVGAMVGSAIRSSNRRSDAFQKGMSDAIYNSFSSHDAREEAYREQRRQADQRARDRWDAIDRQKKAEWDARDAALRGKDKAAYNYQNKADYWRNQSKKY